jgi:hypothetical protein
MVTGLSRISDQGGATNRCRHTGYYSGLGVYVMESRTLRYVLVCDDCGEEMQEVATLDYVPEPVLAIG